MKLNVFLTAILITFVTFIQAQPNNRNQTPEQRAEKQIKGLTKKLGLSADQSTKVQPIILDKLKQLEGVKQQRKSKQIDGKAALEKRNAIVNKADNDILALLNDTQKPIYNKLREEQKQKAAQRIQNRRGNMGRGKKALENIEEQLDDDGE